MGAAILDFMTLQICNLLFRNNYCKRVANSAMFDITFCMVIHIIIEFTGTVLLYIT